MLDTLQAAKERVTKEYPGAQFLQEATPQKNVLFLKRQESARGKPYIPTYATIVESMPSGSIRIALWASGQETKVVHLDMLFTVENDWCQGKPVASHMHYNDHTEGSIYFNRCQYIRRYDTSLDSEEVERLALQDWQSNPDSFTVKK